MGRKFLQEGEVMTFTAPSGGVTVDLPVLIGGLLVVPANSVAQGQPFEGATCGVYINMPKAAGAWTEGQLVYWDTAQSKFVTATSATACRAGVAAAAAAADATTGIVRLNGVAAPLNAA